MNGVFQTLEGATPALMHATSGMKPQQPCDTAVATLAEQKQYNCTCALQLALGSLQTSKGA